MKNLKVVPILAFISLLCFQLNAMEEIPRENLEIISVVANGSGCPLGDGARAEIAHNRYVRLYFNKLKATTDSLRSRRQNCVFTINFAIPEGWTFGPEKIYSFARTDLDSYSSGIIKVLTYFQGGEDSFAEKNLVPDQKRTALFAKKLSKVNLAPCDSERALVVNTQARIRVDRTSSSVDAEGKLTLFSPLLAKIRWERCSSY